MKGGTVELTPNTTEALVIYCNDPRFQKAFRLYTKQILGLEEGTYIPLVLPGGVVSIGSGVQSLLPKSYKAMVDQIKMLLERNAGQRFRLVLFSHEDCQDYANFISKIASKIPRIPGFVTDIIEKQGLDLVAAAKLIESVAKTFNIDLDVELYHASIGEGSRINFEKIEEA